MTYEVPSLAGLAGQVVGAKIPFLNQDTTVRVKVHAVEVSGLWIEDQTLTDRLLHQAGRSSAPATIILFCPFQHIEFVGASVAVPSLSEETL